MNSPKDDFKHLLKFLVVYQTKKTATFAKSFEHFKDLLVEALMLKRGKYQKSIWHGSMVVLCLLALFTSGALGGSSVVASAFPGSGIDDPRTIQTFDPNAAGIRLSSLTQLKTFISSKPRSQIIDYQVKGGDTISGIAAKYGIDADTIKWANDLTSVNDVKPGDTLKILPVSGVAVTVKKGDTLDSLAKKYQAEPQAILDFPFNDIPDNLALSSGQTLIIPDGQPPEVKTVKPKISPQYLAQGQNGNSPSFSAPGGASFIWPTRSVGISQYFAWYHPGLDLPNPAEPPVLASSGGVVVYAGWDTTGYGNRVDINHGNGYLTRYAHLSNIYVSVGQVVGQGVAIGQMGSTGRSTGPHLHFEIHFQGIAVNPLAILK